MDGFYRSARPVSVRTRYAAGAALAGAIVCRHTRFANRFCAAPTRQLQIEQQPAPRRRDLQLAEAGTWIEQVHDEDVAPPPMTVALLGEEERRGQPETTLELEAPDGLLEALLEQSAVTSFA